MERRCTECHSLRRVQAPEELGGTITKTGHIVKIKFKESEVTTNAHALQAASAHLKDLVDGLEVELPLAVSPKGFKVLLGWLSDSEIEVPRYTDDYWTVKYLCEAYNTGDALDVPPEFLDSVMDHIIDTHHRHCRQAEQPYRERCALPRHSAVRSVRARLTRTSLPR
ncbi:hypothetical protein LTR17_015139 [Elasticomyces elasticus]|nr:hypothetical protein LTR17_015139 [Elasticomyces elasticus]